MFDRFDPFLFSILKMSVQVNNEFLYIEFKTGYKCESCEALKCEILDLKKNLLVLTKIDNDILRKVMNQIKSQQKDIFFLKKKVFETHIYDSLVNISYIHLDLPKTTSPTTKTNTNCTNFETVTVVDNHFQDNHNVR